MIRRISKRMSYSRNDSGKSYFVYKEEKSIQMLQPLIWDRPALRERRIQFLGMHNFRDLECILMLKS